MAYYSKLFGDPKLPPLQRRNELQCYHAKKRKDCWYFNNGKCTCTVVKGETWNGVKVPDELIGV